jgi:hypothetical protein
MNNDTRKSHLTSSQKESLREFGMELNRACMYLFIALLALKLAQVGEVQHWSWFYVTAPLWFPYAFFSAIWMIAKLLILILKPFTK